MNLPEVAEYWQQVVSINEWQKHRFAKKIVKCLFNTITSKKIAILGFAFKKNTGDTRESATINVVKYLVNDGALINIYDPQVSEKQIHMDLLEANLSKEQSKKKHKKKNNKRTIQFPIN